MALAFQSGDSIKQALLEELHNILSPNKEIRESAEGKMKHLEITEGYGVYLAEIIMNQQFDLALRQLASVMLTKYVEEHWCLDAGNSGGGGIDSSLIVVANEQAKQMIRKIVPNGLYDPNSKIRSSVAYTISTIAATDWPNTWTDLFDIIVKCLGGNEDSIHGAMQVLIEFTYDLNSQITVVGPVILSEVYRIFEAEQIYAVKIRSCAVTIFKSLLRAVNEHIERKEDKAKMLNPVLPAFIDKLIISLNAPSGQTSSFEMKTEIVKVLTYMVNEMSEFIFQYNSQILPPIWQLLTQTADIYVKVVVNESDTNEDDDEIANFTTLVQQLIEFIVSIVEKSRFRQTVKSVLTDLVYISIVFMQITQEQIKTWSDDADTYVDDFNFDNCESTVRASSSDILINISEEFGPKTLLPALSKAIERHINVAQAEKAADNPNWWKFFESSVTAIGILRNFVSRNQDESKFNLKQFVAFAITQLGRGGVDGSGYQRDVSPFLHNRCLWVLARYSNASADIYDRPTLQTILNCVTCNLQAGKPLHVQISAMLSLYEFCHELKEASPQRDMVIQKLPMFMNFITVIAPVAKNNILSNLLMTISVVISFDERFTAVNHAKVIPFTNAIFLKYYDDPFILEQVKEILQVLAANESCIGPLQEKLVPILVSILRTGSETKNVMQETALDILQTIVKYSKPLSNILIETVFPATVQCILHTDDHAVMQSGGECLRAFINAAPEQVCAYNNGEGLNYIMQVTTLLLNPMTSEFTAAFVGRLVIAIVLKVGNLLGENIHLLLKAVISKMQLVESLSVAMSLVMTFAHLVVTQMDAVLNFLSTVPGPTGEPAIQFVLTHWLSRQHMFYGSYERKVSTMALCKLFEHGITSGDGRLTTVTIRDVVEIPTNLNSTKPRTRAQTAGVQQQWLAIPVMVKMFKLLINELSHLKEESLDNNESDGVTDEDDDAADADTLNDSRGQNVIRTSDLWFDEDDEEDDQLLQELMQDPIFQSGMEENLTKFLQNFSQAEQFREYSTQLTDAEKSILRSIQVNV